MKKGGNNTASNLKFFLLRVKTIKIQSMISVLFLDFETLGWTFAHLNTPNVLERQIYHHENNAEPLPYRLEWPNKKIVTHISIRYMLFSVITLVCLPFCLIFDK